MFKAWQANRQGQGNTRLTLTPSVIPNSNYVVMESEWNCLKYFYVFLYCNRQVHMEFLVALYYCLKPAEMREGWWNVKDIIRVE
jgi:hypothetical protein